MQIADREISRGPQLGQSLSRGPELRVGDNIADSDVSVEKIDASVAFGVQDFVIVEGVVVDTVLLQVEILDGG